MSVERLAKVYSLAASVEALRAEMEAMRADNSVREMKGQSPAWTGDEFISLSGEIQNLAIKLHNIAEGKEEEEK